MGNHTPGPWVRAEWISGSRAADMVQFMEMRRGAALTVGRPSDDHGTTDLVACIYAGRDKAAAEADARLIAAAPAMFEALHKAGPVLLLLAASLDGGQRREAEAAIALIHAALSQASSGETAGGENG